MAVASGLQMGMEEAALQAQAVRKRGKAWWRQRAVHNSDWHASGVHSDATQQHQQSFSVTSTRRLHSPTR